MGNTTQTTTNKNNKTTKNITDGILEYRQFIVLENGKSFRVRPNQKPENYDSDVELYKYSAKTGKGENAKSVTKYAVKHTVPKPTVTRQNKADNILADIASGMTASEIQAKYNG